jgi:hypothetical protein
MRYIGENLRLGFFQKAEKILEPIMGLSIQQRKQNYRQNAHQRD